MRNRLLVLTIIQIDHGDLHDHQVFVVEMVFRAFFVKKIWTQSFYIPRSSKSLETLVRSTNQRISCVPIGFDTSLLEVP